MVPEGDLFRPSPGGSVFNTALALGRLGADAGFLWPLSNDHFGQQLQGLLADSGVDTTLCPRTARPTTLALVHLRTGQAEYAFYDKGTTGDALAALPALSDRVQALFLGGISLIDDGNAAAIATLAEQAQGRLIMLDPNIRPQHIPDMARHRARIMGLAAKPSVIKLSEEDAAYLWPGRALADIAADLFTAGVVLVVITKGAEGATAYTKREKVHQTAPEVTVVDSIGAGDCFNAGLLAALAKEGLLEPRALSRASRDAIARALAAGVAVASFSVTRPGANPPWQHEVSL